MKLSTEIACKEIAEQLAFKYRYYDDVAFGILTDAVYNAIIDNHGEVLPLEQLHDYIKNYYI